jgi:hypothetical protein
MDGNHEAARAVAAVATAAGLFPSPELEAPGNARERDVVVEAVAAREKEEGMRLRAPLRSVAEVANAAADREGTG